MYEHLTKLSDTKKIDPWEAKQEIAEIRVSLHCSRYWMLSEWECENMSFPFWRLYHSCTGGSYVTFNKLEYELDNDKIILIPPYTSFSTHIKARTVKQEESIVGEIIRNMAEVDFFREKGLCDQFFVHFNLGFPYDKFKACIYEIELNEYWLSLINKVKIDRLEFPNNISIHSAIDINCLILYALSSISIGNWELPIIDKRILKAITYIDKNIDKELTNEQLSKIANLATNSFARLFKSELKGTVKNYIQQRRIEHAIMKLHHSSKDIEDIALACGYYDRHHFSKVFKQQTGIPPAKYRLKIGMK
jgi:AraC-like DNA-binding protein